MGRSVTRLMGFECVLYTMHNSSPLISRQNNDRECYILKILNKAINWNWVTNYVNGLSPRGFLEFGVVKVQS